MKSLLKLISSLRPAILHLFIIAAVTIFTIDFYLIKIPELFDGGYKIGQIIYKLSMSYISAFIFYFIVVHMKVQKDKATVQPFLKLMVGGIIGQGLNAINVMCNASQVQIVAQFPTVNEVNELCNGINPHAQAPIVYYQGNNLVNGNWLQYFENSRIHSNNLMEKVFAHLPFLDAELVTLLVKIQDNTHFSAISIFVNKPLANTDFNGFQDGFNEYFNLLQQLQQYEKRKLNS